MEITLLIVQIVIALILCILILIQDKGSGIGEALGGQSSQSSFETTKRGAERLVSRLTIATLIIFMAVSMTLNFIG